MMLNEHAARPVVWLMMLLTYAGSLPAQDALPGQWSLDLPEDEKGWLGVEADRVELLWGVGSAQAVKDPELTADTLRFEKSLRWPPAPRDAPAVRSLITLTADGRTLQGTMRSEDGRVIGFSGKKQPPLPPRPQMSQLEFGEPVRLFNGRDLTGWQVSQPTRRNGWSVRAGLLCNDTPKTDYGAYGEFGNLRTVAEFEDFHLHVEYRLPPEIGGNSGVYIRGMYEVQVTHRDSRMQGINGPGAVFGRIKPTHNAGKPAGEWETLEITLVERHITVVLNGEKVIDCQPIVGCTGGAIKSDVTQPGPVLLQGDHTSVQYRNIILRPLRQGPLPEPRR